MLGGKRLGDLPGVPTIGELLPGVERPADWLGFYGPAGLGAPLVERIHAEMVTALKSPRVVTGLRAAGMEVFGNRPEEFAAIIRRDIELYRRIVPIAGIKPE